MTSMHPLPPVPPAATPWEVFARLAPDLAARVRTRFEGTQQHVLATMTFEGAPRVSGTQVRWVGARLAMLGVQGRPSTVDLRRDPRFALHSNPGDGSRRDGDAIVQGRATPMTLTGVGGTLDAVSPALDGWLAGPTVDGFWLDVTAVGLTTELVPELGAGGLRQETRHETRHETWTPGGGLEVRTEG